MRYCGRRCALLLPAAALWQARPCLHRSMLLPNSDQNSVSTLPRPLAHNQSVNRVDFEPWLRLGTWNCWRSCNHGSTFSPCPAPQPSDRSLAAVAHHQAVPLEQIAPASWARSHYDSKCGSCCGSSGATSGASQMSNHQTCRPEIDCFQNSLNSSHSFETFSVIVIVILISFFCRYSDQLLNSCETFSVALLQDLPSERAHSLRF